MATDVNKDNILRELEACGKKTIDTLHLTSWDSDHCSESGLDWVMTKLAPSTIEYPGYPPHTDGAKRCLTAIREYQQKWSRKSINVGVQAIDPPYIRSLSEAQAISYKDLFYHPKYLKDNSNDNSTVKFFRRGSFTMLSLGDVQDVGIASMLSASKMLCREVDVLILAHHGADNGFTTKKFLEELKPQVAICTSNYSNQFDHPRQEIRDILWKLGIPLYTTKTGDVTIQSTGAHTREFCVTNFIGDTTKMSSQRDFKAKKHYWLSMNADTLRNLMNPGPRGPR
jgi:competence protein ComEC